ncbi:hypothetical protein GCM10018793_48660 [Streptomyces sulfonofaciens]|uniref:Uncharacterized protein n=1 Tax=Streptomyces sulfonofaciens TaxID=68272 RepID=A0A919L5N4_9ACTN|nr:hypothetical protein GCM10018793_48660 [Streptomyces sulfonofaciens]
MRADGAWMHVLGFRAFGSWTARFDLPGFRPSRLPGLRLVDGPAPTFRAFGSRLSGSWGSAVPPGPSARALRPGPALTPSGCGLRAPGFRLPAFDPRSAPGFPRRPFAQARLRPSGIGLPARPPAPAVRLRPATRSFGPRPS